MDAGSELDAEIARKVFGQTTATVYRGRATVFGRAAYHDRAVPPYSTEIGAAWAVVERMGDLGWQYGLTNYRSDHQHHATFAAPRWTPAGPAIAVAATAPLALCRAALLALAAISVEQPA